MKKLTALLLTLMMLLSCLLLCATAEEEPNLYRLYAELLGNREITLTVNAENVVGLEDTLAPYGTVVCSAKQEAGKIIVHVTCGDELAWPPRRQTKQASGWNPPFWGFPPWS